MPPKMRKRWIHDTFDAYQRMKADAGEDDGMGLDGAWFFLRMKFLLMG
jgi:hypothetical protein